MYTDVAPENCSMRTRLLNIPINHKSPITRKFTNENSRQNLYMTRPTKKLM